MNALSSSFVLSKAPSVSPLNPVDQRIVGIVPPNLSVSSRHARKSSDSRRPLTIQASYRDDGRSGSGSAFVGGFVLGGIIVGTLGAVFAPQISKALAETLAGTDKKDLMRKLPKFIYDEEKELEKQRKKLSEKIEQLNSAIDNVSSQLRSEDNPNGAAVNSDEVETLA